MFQFSGFCCQIIVTLWNIHSYHWILCYLVAQSICTNHDFKKFLYGQTSFQHVSMVDSTIFRPVPPPRTKTLLLPVVCCIIHTQSLCVPISTVHRCAALLKLPGTMGIQKVGVGICPIVGMYQYVCVCACTFMCVLIIVTPNTYLHSDQQKSSDCLQCYTSCSGSEVMYSCHHYSSHFMFPMFVHSWHSCLPFITINHTTYMLTKDTNAFV
jgi:hypothetical protein